MHRYYDFKKIFEAEQMGEPLNPMDMNMPAEPVNIQVNPHYGYFIEIMLSQSEIQTLKSGSIVSINTAKWKKQDNLTDIKDISNLTIEETDSNIEDVTDGETVTLKLKPETIQRVINGILEGGVISENIGETQVNFTKSNDEVTTEPIAPITSETPVDGELLAPNESTSVKKIMNFNQFITEGKGGDWIADTMKNIAKGSLKKEMGGKVTKEKIAKSEAELAKKDKDKKKPGLQLGAKDAKSHKRNVLAKNLLNAQKGK